MQEPTRLLFPLLYRRCQDNVYRFSRDTSLCLFLSQRNCSILFFSKEFSRLLSSSSILTSEVSGICTWFSYPCQVRHGTLSSRKESSVAPLEGEHQMWRHSEDAQMGTSSWRWPFPSNSLECLARFLGVSAVQEAPKNPLPSLPWGSTPTWSPF